MKKNVAYIFNPILFFGIGLFPALLVCNSLKSACLFSAFLMIELILTNLILSAFKPLILDKVRIPCYVLVSFAVIYLIDSLVCGLLPKRYSSVSTYIQLLFVAVVTIFNAEYTSKEERFSNSVLINLRVSVSYALFLILVGAIRECLGNGTIWEVSVGIKAMPFFETYVGALLIITLCGFVYNLIAEIFLRNKRIYQSLVTRYTLYLENSFDNDALNGSKKGEQK